MSGTDGGPAKPRGSYGQTPPAGDRRNNSIVAEVKAQPEDARPGWARNHRGMVDAHERLTGRVDLTINVQLPGMLHGVLLRSDSPHARIISIDTSAAKQVPGVLAVLTGADLVARGDVRPRFGPVFRDEPMLAIDKVRYVGEPVVACAAVDRDTAMAALDLVTVEYEQLPAVFTTDESLAPGAPVIHEEPPEVGATFADIMINKNPDTPNICNSFKLRRGDIEQGFAEADHVFEDVFTSPAVQHTPLETHCAVASYELDKLTITTTSQIPYMVRGQLAEVFGLPASKVQVIVPNLGGGYGGKCYPSIEPITAMLSKATRRPVKLHLTREEEFVTISKHGAKIRMKTGLKKDGTIIARQVTAHFNAGAYANISPRLIKNGGYGTNGPTDIPHVWIDSYAVHTNIPNAGAFRGYGISQAAWAYETQIEMIADRLGMDPYELRMKNLLVDGSTFGTGETMHDVHFKELLTTAKERIGWEWPVKRVVDGPLVRAKGLSCIIKGTITPSTSTCSVKLNDDGSFHVLTSSIEIGQGVHTLLSILASEQLQLPIERIKVARVDTDVTPYDQQTSSSRSTHSMGLALTAAIDDVRSQLYERASILLGVPESELELRDGRVAVVGSSEPGLDYGSVVRGTRAGNIVGRGVFQSDGTLDPQTGQGIGAVHWHQATGAAEVEVDVETGRVRVLRYHGGVYAGRVINPVQAELQAEGNFSMGMGQALWEEMLYDNGQLQNGSMADYMISSFPDMPAEIDHNILESGDPNAELHGIGETGLPAVMPAVANAVFHATGVRITDLPVTSEKVLRGLMALRAAEEQAVMAGATKRDDGKESIDV